MMDTGKTEDILAFEAGVKIFYDNVKSKNLNYFELLGIQVKATHREIETAYRKYSDEFSEANVARISDPELQKKGQHLVTLGKRAYEVLINFEKRALYEKMNFRDIDPDSLKEVEPVDKAREIYRKAKTLYNQKNFSLAARAMEEAIAYDPAKPDYYLLLGLSQTQMPEYRRRAEVNLLKAAELESWNAEHQFALGMLFYSERLPKRAESYFRKCLEIEPNHLQATRKLKEITGPEATTLDKIQNALGKVFPTFFSKKKK